MLPSLLRRHGRRPDGSGAADAASQPETVMASRAFPKFLAALSGREHVTIVDAGPVIGSNLEFFAERANCRFHVEDFFAEVERHARAGTRETLATVLPERLQRPDASVDAVLCWDIFDFLDKTAGQALAREIVRVLKPGGAVFGFFSNAAGQQTQYTRFVIADESHFRLRTMPATPVARHLLPNRDIIRLFDGLVVAESFLLLTHTREIVFRKR